MVHILALTGRFGAQANYENHSLASLYSSSIAFTSRMHGDIARIDTIDAEIEMTVYRQAMTRFSIGLTAKVLNPDNAGCNVLGPYCSMGLNEKRRKIFTFTRQALSRGVLVSGRAGRAAQVGPRRSGRKGRAAKVGSAS